jgi:hypothetical protein
MFFEAIGERYYKIIVYLCTLLEQETMTIEQYYYGLAALMYLITCWMFAAVRWFHTCRAPKERRRYI